MTHKLPDGPNAASWWQLIRWRQEPLEYQKECAQSYGDIFTLRVKGFPPLVLTTPHRY